MRIGSLSQALWTAIAWAPVLAILVASLTFVASGVAHLEARTWGTEYIIPERRSEPPRIMTTERVLEQYRGHSDAIQ